MLAPTVRGYCNQRFLGQAPLTLLSPYNGGCVRSDDAGVSSCSDDCGAGVDCGEDNRTSNSTSRVVGSTGSSSCGVRGVDSCLGLGSGVSESAGESVLRRSGLVEAETVALEAT
jgi:hypothetical protein